MDTRPHETKIAYFSMEIALETAIPAYSGGLGVLAGDTLRSAADLGLPMAAVSLVHRKGYFRQHLDADGTQHDSPRTWSPEDVLEAVEPRVTIDIRGEPVHIRAWKYTVRGIDGDAVPVYLLDTDLPENTVPARALTDHLYGGDAAYRLSQEAILGIGGVAMLRALGYGALDTFHMNEGHAALLSLALLEERTNEGDFGTLSPGDYEAVRRLGVFTTHTPVAAGHDHFDWELVREVLGERRTGGLRLVLDEPDLDMSSLALGFARFTNGVAMRHGAVSRAMFPGHTIHAITNGVHARTWTSQPFQDLFDRYIPDWRRDGMVLRHALSIPAEEIAEAHCAAKRNLMSEIDRRARDRMALNPEAFTIGFARRATGYKRSTLVFSDLDRLRAIAREQGPIQFIFAGKAHPQDHTGQHMIRRVFEAADALGDDVRVIYLEDYDMDIASAMVAGVDLWLNTPMRPLEASGTSGMKAALNGVPSFSVLDGWWVEGCIEGVTGWAIGQDWSGGEPNEGHHMEDVASLYNKLERIIVPMYYRSPQEFAAVRRSTIAFNGSMFTTQRMMQQYARLAYKVR